MSPTHTLEVVPSGCINLLYPLDRFYQATHHTPPCVEQIDGQQMPQPYRDLLVGAHDMTPTLEAYHECPLSLRVIDRWNEADRYTRQVVLIRDTDGVPVEFGAIEIRLDLFSDHAAERILEGKTPLGAILAQELIRHTSQPQAFLRVLPDRHIADALGVDPSETLYGRRNHLLTEDGRVFADILEILPR